MKLSRQESAEILDQFKFFYNNRLKFDKIFIEISPARTVCIKGGEFNQAIDTAIQALGETKLIDDKSTDGYFYGEKITKCCKIGPITTEKYCPECGKKIIR